MRWEDRVPRSDTGLELDGDELLVSLGFVPRTLPDGVPVQHRTIRRLYPDRVVDVPAVSGFPPLPAMTKVVLFDGWHWHNRTHHQEVDSALKDGLYVAAGYFVVHVGDWWFKNESNKERLQPLLVEALRSGRPVELLNI